MSVLKSLLGSLIGAAIAIGIHYVVKQSTGQTFIWFPIVIGVLTGLFSSMFMGFGTSNVARYLAGALAGIIAGTAIFGIDVVPTLMAAEPEFEIVPLKERLQTVTKDSAESSERDDDRDSGTGDTDADEADSTTDSADDDAATVDEGDSGDESTSADVDETADDSEQADIAAGDTDADANAQSGDQAVPATDRVDPNQAFKDRGVVPERVGGPDNSSINEERFAELIKKQKQQTWYEQWMPYVFAGLGILIAYQLARGFGSASSGEAAAKK